MTEPKEILKAYRKLKQDESEERSVGKLCFEYVNNWVDGELGQWEKKIRNVMGDRPMLSINLIKKFVNRICGSQRSAKVEEKIIPRDSESDPLIADILTDLLKYSYDVNLAEKIHIPRAFRDMVIWRGYVKVEWSDENDPLGEVTIKALDPKNVFIWGHGIRYDLMDRKGIIEVLLMDKEEVKNRWSKYKDDIDNLIGSKDEVLETSQAEGEDYSNYSRSDYWDDIEEKCIILRTQKFEYVDVQFAEMPDGSLQEVLAKDIPQGLKIIKKKVRKVNVYYTLGNILLETQEAPNKHNRFDIVRFASYTDGGMVTSPVQDLIDVQNEKNKRRSQVIHILNSSPRNNYFVAPGAFTDVKDAEKRMGGINQLIPVNTPNLSEAVKPIESNLTAVPAIISMEQESSQDMKEISGLGDASMGNVPEGVRSGRGIQALQQPTETIIAEIFDNYLISRQLVAILALSLIQQHYTTYRRVRILGDYTSKFLSGGDKQFREAIKQQIALSMQGASNEAVDLKTNEIIMFQPGMKLLAINIQVGEKKLNDISVGKYDVVFDHVSQSPTTRRAQYYDLLNLMSMGIPVPPKFIISASDMRNKQELIEAIEMAMQAQAMEQAIMQTAGTQKKATPSKPQEGDAMLNSAGNQMPQMV